MNGRPAGTRHSLSLFFEKNTFLKIFFVFYFYSGNEGEREDLDPYAKERDKAIQQWKKFRFRIRRTSDGLRDWRSERDSGWFSPCHATFEHFPSKPIEFATALLFFFFSPLIGDQTKAENVTGNQRRSKRSVTSLRYLADNEEDQI